MATYLDDIVSGELPGRRSRRRQVISSDPIDIAGFVQSESDVQKKPMDEKLSTAEVRQFSGTNRNPRVGEVPTSLNDMIGAAQPDRFMDFDLKKIDRDITEPKPVPPTPEVAALQDIAQAERESARMEINRDLALAAGKFFLNTLNADSAYRGQELATRLNILESRRLAQEALQRAGQRSIEARGEGYLNAEQAMLSLAAQGQDVSSASVQNVVGSIEQIGEANALKEEIAGIREVLGYDLQEVSMLYELDQAGITRDFDIASSALEFGLNASAATGLL